jgi:hypothetical protein
MDTLTPMAELATRWGITANTVSRRLAFLGIKAERQGNLRYITAEQLAQGDALQDHIVSGKPMELFPRADQPDGGLVTRRVSGSGLVTGQVEQMAAMAAAMAAAMPTASADPLRRAKALAEAADNALVLTTDELVAIGVKGVDGFADGDLAFGYAFSKHQQRNRTLWTVERVIGKKPVTDITAQALTAGKADKQVGFGLGATLAARGGATIFATNSLRSR